MKSRAQRWCWISSLRRRTVTAALALAAVLLPAVVATRPARAQTFTQLYQFVGGSRGANPVAGLVRDAAGNLYGTTSAGGVIGGTCKIIAGCGVVFKLDTSGTETVLYSFTGLADGTYPLAGLVLDASGNLYGTTSGGGVAAGTCLASNGCGVVFKLDPAGAETVLHSFTGSPDGDSPRAGLVLDAAGNLYGTTLAGGASNLGTVFKLDTAGTETVLHSFAGPEGSAPTAGLVLDAAGNLYGTTAGTAFKLDTIGTVTVLHTFTGSPDGAGPLGAGLVPDAGGNLYGTAPNGGALHCLSGQNQPVGCGIVFKLNPAGVETVYNFTAGGDRPGAGLVRDSTGNLYGTAEFTGPHADSIGLVFKMDPNGAETALFHFADDGLFRAGLVAGLILDAAGILYGTTESGGFFGAGTVFKLDPAGPANFALTVAPAGNGSGTVTGNPPGINCPSSCSAFLFPGTAVTLTAAAAAGSTFAGWTGPCSGTGACNLTTTNSAEVVIATFNLMPDFSLSASALTPGTVTPGASSTSTVNVSAVNAFSGSVAITCSVQPAPALAPTCSISPTSASPGTSATLTVHTTGPTAAVMPSSAGSGLLYALCLPLIGLVAIRVGFGSGQNSNGRITAVVLACVLCAGLVFQAACGGGSSSGSGGSSGTPAGAYTITVSGTDASGSLKHSVTTMLTVQ